MRRMRRRKRVASTELHIIREDVVILVSVGGRVTQGRDFS